MRKYLFIIFVLLYPLVSWSEDVTRFVSSGEDIAHSDVVCQKYSDGLYYNIASSVCHDGSGQFVDGVAMDRMDTGANGRIMVSGTFRARAKVTISSGDTIYADPADGKLTNVPSAFTIGKAGSSTTLVTDSFRLNVIVQSSGTGGGHIIQDEGVDLAAEARLNFIGSAIICVDNPGTSTDCTITGGGAHTLLDATDHTDTVTHVPVLGDIIYGNATPKWTALTGNVTTTKKTLNQTGTGAVSAVPVWSQLACGDLSNAATSCSTDATNATNISSGTLACGRFPAITGDVTSSSGSCATTLANIPTATPMAGYLLATNITAPSTPASGKDAIYVDSTDKRLHDKNDAGAIGTTVVADTGSSNNFLTAISAAGVISKAQPSFSNISGTFSTGQVPDPLEVNTIKVNEDFNLQTEISPTSIASDQNNYNPTSAHTSTIWHLTSSISVHITGIDAPSTNQFIVIINDGVNTIILDDQSSSSTSTNRFDLQGGNAFIKPDGTAIIQYSTTNGRWRFIGGKVRFANSSETATTADLVGIKSYATTTQSVAASSTPAAVFNENMIDTSQFRSETANQQTNNFMVPSGQSGYYLVMCSTSWAADGATRSEQFVLNGTSIFSERETVSSPADPTTNIVDVFNLTEGDRLACLVTHASVSSININTFSTTTTSELGSMSVFKLNTFHGASADEFSAADQVIATATPTAITYASELFDTDAYHDTSSNTDRLTVPTGLDGYYMIGCTISVNSGANVCDNCAASAIIEKNGGGTGSYLAQSYKPPSTTASFDAQAWTVANLAAGDYVKCKMEQNSGGNVAARTSLAGTRDNHFWMYRIENFHGWKLGTTATRAITASVELVIIWDQETIDTDAYHDNATNNTKAIIPAGLGGFYVMGCTTKTTKASANAFFQTWINTSSGRVGMAAVSDDGDANSLQGSSVTDVGRVTTSDSATCSMLTNAGTPGNVALTNNGDSSTQFWGFRLTGANN